MSTSKQKVTTTRTVVKKRKAPSTSGAATTVTSLSTAAADAQSTALQAALDFFGLDDVDDELKLTSFTVTDTKPTKQQQQHEQQTKKKVKVAGKKVVNKTSVVKQVTKTSMDVVPAAKKSVRFAEKEVIETPVGGEAARNRNATGIYLPVQHNNVKRERLDYQKNPELLLVIEDNYDSVMEHVGKEGSAGASALIQPKPSTQRKLFHNLTDSVNMDQKARGMDDETYERMLRENPEGIDSIPLPLVAGNTSGTQLTMWYPNPYDFEKVCRYYSEESVPDTPEGDDVRNLPIMEELRSIIFPVPRRHMEAYMRQPFHGEPACANRDQCFGMRCKVPQPFTLVSFLFPNEDPSNVPNRSARLCILCLCQEMEKFYNSHCVRHDRHSKASAIAGFCVLTCKGEFPLQYTFMTDAKQWQGVLYPIVRFSIYYFDQVKRNGIYYLKCLIPRPEELVKTITMPPTTSAGAGGKQQQQQRSPPKAAQSFF